MSNEYDFVIIGAGLRGLICGAALAKRNYHFQILEASENLGGLNHSVTMAGKRISNGLRFLPNSADGVLALLFLEDVLGIKLSTPAIERPPITFEANEFKTFLGFGDNPPAYHEELNYYTSTEQIIPTIPFSQWTHLLCDKVADRVSTRNLVTSIIVENDRVVGVRINGSKTLATKRVIFTGNVQSLTGILNEDQLGPKQRQRLTKSKFWTGVGVDFLHGEVISNKESIHLLTGSEDKESCVGEFLPAIDSQQISQWLTFVNLDGEDENELYSQAIKLIKKRVKRAYPDAFNQLKGERIMIAPNLGGYCELKLDSHFGLPGLEGFHMVGSGLDLQKNLVGAINRVGSFFKEIFPLTEKSVDLTGEVLAPLA